MGAADPGRMTDRWSLRCNPPDTLVRPVAVDRTGKSGPSRGQAQGPLWRRTSPRLFVPAAVDPGLVEQRILEQSMRLPSDGAVGGWAALRLHGGGFFDGMGRDGRTPLSVPLVIPPGRNLRPTEGVIVVREPLKDDEVRTIQGVRCTEPVRAVFDEARWAESFREAVVVIDTALAAALVSHPRLEAFTTARRRWRRARQVARALPWVTDRSRSPAESRMRLIWMVDAGLPIPLCNWPVADLDGNRIGRPDLLCEELAVVGEFDGADHRTRQTQRDDVAKEDEYRNAGLECFRAVGADLENIPRLVTRMTSAARRAQEAGRPRSWMRRSDPGPL